MAKNSKQPVTVRILADAGVASKQYRPNDVVQMPASMADGLVKSGQADPDEAAVAYALENGADLIVHGADEDAVEIAATDAGAGTGDAGE